MSHRFACRTRRILESLRGFMIVLTVSAVPIADSPCWSGSSGETQLIRDIGLSPAGSGAEELTPAGGFLFFNAHDGVHGDELFKIDPVDLSLEVIDIYPGPERSDPELLVEVGGLVYFIAEDQEAGEELHRYDPTTGELTLYDLNPGSDDGGISRPFFVHEGLLYFQGETADDRGILCHDPATGETVLLAGRTTPTSVSTNLEDFAVIGRDLYFVASDGNFPDTIGSEVWKVNLDSKAISLVKDLVPGSSGSQPRRFLAVGGKLFFTAELAATGRELYYHDPTTNTTDIVLDAFPGTGSGDATSLIELDGDLYYRSGEILAGKFKGEIYRADPETLAAEPVTDGGPNSFGLSPSNLVILDGRIFFAGANNPEATERDIWRYDPGSGMTEKMTNLFPGGSSQPDVLTVIDGSIYFRATDGSTGSEPYRYSPATGQTMRLADLIPGADASSPREFEGAGGRIFFVANHPELGQEVIVYDPATEQIAPIDVRPGTIGSVPDGFVEVGGRIYFLARETGLNGLPVVWRYDPVTKETVRLVDVHTGPDFTGISGSLFSPPSMAAFDDRIIAGGRTTGSDIELLIHDPSSNETTMVDINQAGGSSPFYFFPTSDRLYFSALRSDVGNELFYYDANTEAVSLAVDIADGQTNSNPVIHLELDGKLYLEASTPATGFELFEFDRATGMAVVVKDAVAGSGNGLRRLIEGSRAAALGGKIYFAARDGEGGTGVELHRFDPSSRVVEVFDILMGAGDSNPSHLTVLEGFLYFSGSRADFQDQLYRFDPASGQAERVGGPEGLVRPRFIKAFGANLFFVGVNEVQPSGFRVWTHQPGTGMTKILEEEIQDEVTTAELVGPFTEAFVPLDDHLFFVGSRSDVGTELFAAAPDGSVRLMADVDEGIEDGNAAGPIALGDSVYFQATDGLVGQEPYRFILSSGGGPTPTPTPGDPSCPQPYPDFVVDQFISAKDLIELVRDLREKTGQRDLTGDALTDGSDLLKFSLSWQRTNCAK